MRTLTRPRAIAIALAAATMAIGGLQPLMARPGYESALLAGVVLPAAAAVATARELCRVRWDGFAMLARAVETGLLLAFVAYAVTFVHGLIAGMCGVVMGSLLFALGPGVGAVLGAVWGAVGAELGGMLTRRRPGRRAALAVVVALAGPVGSLLVSAALFYTTPMVFAFDPFVGYFSGALYDTVLQSAALYSYRAASAATLLAVCVAALHLRRDVHGRLRYHSMRRPGLLALGAAALLASAASVASGPRLGHWQTAGSIGQELGGELTRGSCRLHFDRRIAERDADRLARECDGWVGAIRSWLGADDDQPITVFLFANAGDKRRLMGAAGTSIAKPWRREIYLQHAGYPHPSLGHELVHVIAGSLGPGPFRVAGRVGGWLPDPGLIEGLAVAAAPRDDDLTATEWAAAMRHIGVMPPLRQLFSLSFLSSNSAAAYTAAGAFVAWVRQRFGAVAVRRWYGGASLDELVGLGWPALERQWHAWLDRLPSSEVALTAARARFDRPGVFARRCPHAVDARLSVAAGRSGSGDPRGALAAYRWVLSLDPANLSARFGVARCHDRSGRAAAGRTALETIAGDTRLAAADRARAIERLGDLLLRSGAVDGARKMYRQAARSLVNEDRLRTLDVKQRYAADPVARAALVALLIGQHADGPRPSEALDLIGAWRTAAADTDGTPAYLLARQHLAEGHYQLAAERLSEALGAPLPVARVKLEAWRLSLVSDCALGRPRQARAALAHYRAHPLVRHARAAYATALVARCTAVPAFTR